MKVIFGIYSLLLVCFAAFIITGSSGCAQIGSIAGGNKDTLAPVLVSSSPKLMTSNFTGNKITLTFDEYVDELQDIPNNIVVSPYPKITPVFTSKFKTVSIKLKDSLLPNTTYAINFGNSIKDIREGNIIKDFTYVFSTGSTIDSLTLTGNVELAETGKIDSTIIVMLYRDATDSSVEKLKPNYISFVKSDGSFTFHHLPPGNFNIYALKDGDGGKTYNSKTELFAFADQPIVVNNNTTPVKLYAYAEEIQSNTPNSSSGSKPKAPAPKTLRYSLQLSGQKQDIRENLVLEFNKAIKTIDTSKIILSDTNFIPVRGISYVLDSNKLVLKTTWLPDADYKLVVNKNAVTDSTDSTLAKTDTVRLKTRGNFEYGRVVLRFNNIDLGKHPVLQFIQQDQIKESFPLTGKEWSYKLFPPGEYEIRILYDDNNNGKWDPGSYSKKRQPEKVVLLPKKFSVKDDWDNEIDINL